MLNLTSMMMTARIILGITIGDERHIIKCYMRSTDKETHSCKHFSCSEKFALQTVICLAKREVQLNSQHIFLPFFFALIFYDLIFIPAIEQKAVFCTMFAVYRRRTNILSLSLSLSLSHLFIHFQEKKSFLSL